MFQKILIANRGEIAVRVIRTARRLGIATVAVYSDADRSAPHVRLADEAYGLGGLSAQESYLRGDAVIEIAKAAGADAIHPGYGFLSENAGFARACAAAGITFIGPRPDTIAVMGSKSLSKDLMAAAGVPLSPGYQGEDQAPETFREAAARIGYPVLLKAAAGGGGKGMRIVEADADMEAALAAARREAKSSFGDDRVLVEKFIEAPRHIEVQVFGDTHGNVVHLFERDCSVQRRYQKVVEEAPAPDLPEAVRERLLAAGVEAARAVNYVGAGTVEFLYDGGENVYFMEMNTRLQVEHPVTEEITGLDLVEWQIRVASGEPLPLEQDQIYADGHAVEVRLYAEDPAQDYRPSIGTLSALSFGAGVRVDSGVEAGSSVTPYYDAMIAKVIARGETRVEAINTLSRALRGARVEGLRSNLAFLDRVLTHPVFRQGAVTTRFLREHTVAADPSPDDTTLALVTFALAGGRFGFWPNLPGVLMHDFRRGVDVVRVQLKADVHHVTAEVGAAAFTLERLQLCDGTVTAECEGRPLRVMAVRREQDEVVCVTATGVVRIGVPNPLQSAARGADAVASLLSPMPSTVTSIAVAAGDSVAAGQIMMTLEAMKMEHIVRAPSDGVVERVHFRVGDAVPDGVRLFDFAARSAPA